MKYVDKQNMLHPGDFVVAGVSGGADSVCLFLVLCKLREKIPFTMQVVHVNHGVRPDAENDKVYVRSLCEHYEVPFLGVDMCVEQIAKEKGMSVEEAGRWARYRAFSDCIQNSREALSRKGRVSIAVAHHKDDRAETMLFNLFRGSGVKGLGGILPVTEREDGTRVIRPLLCVERREIEEFLKEEKMPYCTDSTNAKDDYTRNRIRHHILPMIKEEVCESAVQNMNRTMDLLAEAQDFLEKEALRAADKCRKMTRNGEEYEVKGFKQYHPYLQKQMLLDSFARLTPGRKDITAGHVEDVLSLFLTDKNRSVSLPYALVAKREYDKVVISIRPEGEAGLDNAAKQLSCLLPLSKLQEEESRYLLPDGRELVFSVLNYKKTMNIPQNRYTKWFDCDKMKKSLEIRTRKPGDYLVIDGEGRKKSLQDYMVNEKIPKDDRDFLPLLTEENHVIWVLDYRISSFYKVDTNTKRILQVQLRGGR